MATGSDENGFIHLSYGTRKELMTLFDDNLFNSPLIKDAVGGANKQAKQRQRMAKQQSLYSEVHNIARVRPVDSLDATYDYNEDIFVGRVIPL